MRRSQMTANPEAAARLAIISLPATIPEKKFSKIEKQFPQEGSRLSPSACTDITALWNVLSYAIALGFRWSYRVAPL
jgi:hypothetical protein